MILPIDLYISTLNGTVPLTPERSLHTLPEGPDSTEPTMSYGTYMEILADFLARDGFSPLLQALSLHLGCPVSRDSIQKVRLISEKHGALYSVARIHVQMNDRAVNLVMNVAIAQGQQEVLENECMLLQTMHSRFGLPFLPRAYLLGQTSPAAGQLGEPSFRLFIGEWFDDFHEFHLSTRAWERTSPGIRLWHRPGEEDVFLNPGQTHELYRRMSFILTSYFDPRTFAQIYPWHHAAGDFIIRLQGDRIDLRLVTVRGYQALADLGEAPEGIWIAPLHFLLNLTIRLRLDRLDGTGDLAWAHEECTVPILKGFMEAWQSKAHRFPSVPSPGELLSALQSFTVEELWDFAETAMEDGLIEDDEHTFLAHYFGDHMRSLHEALRGRSFEHLQ